MRPAFSIIFFTTASGTGYGMLFMMAVLYLRNELPSSIFFLLLAFGIAFALITVGLLSSTLHLGNPQRAWRALSQWRTSWLSREGVMAVITYPIAGLFALSTLIDVLPHTVIITLAAGTAVCAALTVFTTACIYSTLKTIAQWNHILVTPTYLLLALSGGCCVLFCLSVMFAHATESMLVCTTILLVVSVMIKRLYWREIDRMKNISTPETATGLGRIGQVRSLEHPHSQENWVMHEMGFQVGRGRSKSLRMICMICLLAALACTMLIGTFGSAAQSATTMTFALAILPLLATGLLTERWLLFAEAKHVVMNYYR